MADEKKEATTLSLQLAAADVQKIIRESINANVVATMAARGPEIISAWVDEALTRKVDNDGRPCSYGEPLIMQVVHKTIREELRTIVKQWIEENRDTLRKTVSTYLTTNRAKLSGQVVDALISGPGSGFELALKVDFSASKKERY